MTNLFDDMVSEGTLQDPHTQSVYYQWKQLSAAYVPDVSSSRNFSLEHVALALSMYQDQNGNWQPIIFNRTAWSDSVHGPTVTTIVDSIRRHDARLTIDQATLIYQTDVINLRLDDEISFPGHEVAIIVDTTFNNEQYVGSKRFTHSENPTPTMFYTRGPAPITRQYEGTAPKAQKDEPLVVLVGRDNSLTLQDSEAARAFQEKFVNNPPELDRILRKEFNRIQ